MSATVVNIRKSGFDVYIGRAGRGYDGYWGNPVKVGAKCSRCGEWHMTAGSTFPCYTNYLVQRILTDDEFVRRLADLDGKRLGCFCAPGPCHGDILVRAIELVNAD